MKTAYICLDADILHSGHLALLEKAREYDRVVVGTLSDEAMMKSNRFSTIGLEGRLRICRSLGGVDEILVQQDPAFGDVIEFLHPDFIIHSEDWGRGGAFAREKVVGNLRRFGGELIEIPCPYDAEIVRAERSARERLSMPEYRRKRLRQLLTCKPFVRVIEAHSGLTGLIAEKTTVISDRGEPEQFDAMWVSSLCDSTEKGKPDIELVDMTSRFRTIDDLTEVTTKPIIFDGDTGGLKEHFAYTVRTLEKMGVSAVIIEDKIGLKRNSLFGKEVIQKQDSVANFCAKIKAGKEAQLTDEFMLIARIESLILEQGMEDALRRAAAYVDAGADGIMIHSRKKTPDEVFEFCDRFRQTDVKTPIVVVPTSFDDVLEEELSLHGVNIVIYANQLIRSAFPAMRRTAEDILRYHRAKEANERLLPVQEIITLIDGV